MRPNPEVPAPDPGTRSGRPGPAILVAAPGPRRGLDKEHAFSDTPYNENPDVISEPVAASADQLRT